MGDLLGTLWKRHLISEAGPIGPVEIHRHEIRVTHGDLGQVIQ